MSFIADLINFESQKNLWTANSAKHTTEYIRPSVSLTAENFGVLAPSTFVQVPVPVLSTTRLANVEVEIEKGDILLMS